MVQSSAVQCITVKFNAVYYNLVLCSAVDTTGAFSTALETHILLFVEHHRPHHDKQTQSKSGAVLQTVS